MKILHILNHSFPLLDGYASRSQNIFRAQKNMGWTPVVLTSPKHEQDLKKKCPSKKETIDGFVFYRSGENPVKNIPLLGDFFLMAMVFFHLVKIIKKEKPVLLHAHSPVLNYLPAWLAGKIFSLPVVYELRAYWEDAGVDQATYKPASVKYRMVRALETWACKNARQVAVLCDGIRNDMVSRGVPHNKMTPVFNGIHPENLTPCAPDIHLAEKWQTAGKRVIGFIGSFYRYEGLDLLVSAFARLAPDHPDLVLLLVGGGEVEEKLKQQAEGLNLSHRVIMPGRIPHHQVPGVYAMMDIMVYPRWSIRLTELVTPLKPLEAMAMGKTVIASDIGGHRELITHNQTGILFQAGSDSALARAIAAVLRDEPRMQAFGAAGRAYVLENKTWQKTTSVYQTIYSRLGI